MSVHYESPDVRLYHGDALEVSRELGSGSVQSIVTSPPYFGLRDYGESDQIGAEASVDEYVSRLVGLFRQLRRVLADDGTLWLNLGDSYASTGGMSGVGVNARVGNTLKQHDSRTRPHSEMPAKNLLGVPWRVAFALQADGWILRSDIIWAKPNAMPESVTDRPTSSHEHIFLFAKMPRYFYNGDAIKEADSGKPSGNGYARPERLSLGGRGQSEPWQPGEGRNKRNVWMVPTSPFPGSHFAVYPPDLIRPCIRAGSRPGDTILDPFSGSGTTGAVATFEGRKYIGIDLNKEYLEMSLRTRFQQPTLPWDAA